MDCLIEIFQFDLKSRPRQLQKYIAIICCYLLRSWLFLLCGQKEILKNLLPCFTSFKSCCVIIDCTEIYIERPTNLNARAQTWSNYKHTNTIKFLIVITLAGAVSFLSRGWSSKVSDKKKY